jgi:hypothetical protein
LTRGKKRESRRYWQENEGCGRKTRRVGRGGVAGRKEKEESERKHTMPSRLAPYPARPRLPIAHTAGQSPRTFDVPGRVTLLTRIPPVKQNLFQEEIMPPVKAQALASRNLRESESERAAEKEGREGEERERKEGRERAGKTHCGMTSCSCPRYRRPCSA